MKYVLLLCLVASISIPAFGQTGLKNAPDTKYITVSNSDPFLISTRPITNREYIVYLLWISNVYGADYPDNLLKAIPGMNATRIDIYTDVDFDFNKTFKLILKYSPEFVRLYMFNPDFIDYPVIGLSRLQAGKFCKWLSDRYNEITLVQHGYFKPPAFQINEDCFVTEAYLAGQYYGLRIKEETLNWSDRLLIPAFRLPLKRELDQAGKEKSFKKEFKSYRYDSTSFLNHWHKMYLKVFPDSLILNYFLEDTEIINKPEEGWHDSQKNYKDLTLDMEQSPQDLSLLQVFKNNGQNELRMDDYIGELGVEKDSLGQMPFIIIGENSRKQPIVVEKFKREIEGSADNAFSFIRFVCNIRPGQFPP